ncbi:MULTISPECIES: hypothetical protein [Microbacterium]|uniref:hypothetical protein n=1 Tax=Microbacterium TaxID=33882 RepID=UPI0011EB73CF|nr:MULTISPECIES: hypothetical protein [Microbacterium]
MSLKDQLLTGPTPREYPDKVRSWRSTLDDETREAFDAAVNDPRWSDSALARMLTGSGFKVSEPTIKRYRDNQRVTP